MKKLLSTICCLCLWSASTWAQSSPVIYFQTSPEGAKVSHKKKDFGTTPILIDLKELNKKGLKIELEGYHTQEVKGIISNTVAYRLKPLEGYNRAPVKSPFICITTSDTLYIDPMEMLDLGNSYNCNDTEFKYRILGNSSLTLADKIKGCDIKYIARYSISDPVLGNYFDKQDYPFPIQQKWVDISPINLPTKKSKKTESFGRFKNQQHWYIIAQEGAAQLLMLPSGIDPADQGKRASADLSGERPMQAVFATFLYEENGDLKIVNDGNFMSILDKFSSNTALMESATAMQNFRSFTYNLFEDPYILGDIFQETWSNSPRNKQKESKKDESEIKEFLANRDKSQPISIGGEQNYWIDSSEVVSETSETPWFLKGEKSLSDSTITADELYYAPEGGVRSDSNKVVKGKWYLRNEDGDYEEYDALSPRHENVFKPKQSIKEKYPDKKAWYLKKP